MPAMRRWRDFSTGVVHGFDPLRHPAGAYVQAFCGLRMRLKNPHTRFGVMSIGFDREGYMLTMPPSGKRLTHELPSVKTQMTCLGCLAEGR